MLKGFIDVFRWLLWVIVTALLKISDLLFKTLQRISTYKFLTDSVIKNYFTAFIVGLLGFFIIFRLCKRYLKTVVNEQEAQALDPLDVIIKVSSIVVLVAIVPYLLQFFGSLQTDLINNAFKTSASDGNFSTIVFNSFVNFDNLYGDYCTTTTAKGGYLICDGITAEGKEYFQKYDVKQNGVSADLTYEKFLEELPNRPDWQAYYEERKNSPVYSIDPKTLQRVSVYETEDQLLNATWVHAMFSQFNGDEYEIPLYDLDITHQSTKGTYDFLNDWGDFFVVFISGLASSYIMILIGIQIAGRYLSMILKLIVAPYSISSVIEGNDDSFKSWWKLFIADFISNYLQVLLLIIVTTVFINIDVVPATDVLGGDDSLKLINNIAKIIIYCGALIGILNAPSGIGQLLGADIGMHNAMQGLQTFMAGSNILKAGAKIIGGAGVTAGAATIYGAGRALGGKSIGEMSSDAGQTSPMSIIGKISGNEGFNEDGKSSGSEIQLQFGGGQATKHSLSRENSIASVVGSSNNIVARGASVVGGWMYQKAGNRLSHNRISSAKSNASNNFMKTLAQQQQFINNQQPPIN